MIMYDKPTKAHLMPASEVAANIKAIQEEHIKADNDKEARAQAEAKRVREEQAEKAAAYKTEQYTCPIYRAKFLENAKTGFVTAALFKVIKESMNSPLTPTDEATLKGMVAQFVEEQGAGPLLNRFKYKNVVLAELGRVCREAYDRTVRKINHEEGVEFDTYDTSDMESHFAKERPVVDQPKPMADVLKLDSQTVDKFYTDMDDIDSKQASDMIKDKVKDSINQFLDNNLETRIKCEEIMNDANQKIAAARAANGVPEPPKPEAPSASAPSSDSGNTEEPPASEDGTPSDSAPGDEAPSNDGTDDLTKSAPDGSKENEPANNAASGTKDSQDKSGEGNKPEAEKKDDKEPTQESAYIEGIKRIAKQRINEIQINRVKNPFHFMVEAVTRHALKDDALRKQFVQESNRVDMQGIMHTAEIVYTMLETFNTLQVVDESYIKDYLRSLMD